MMPSMTCSGLLPNGFRSTEAIMFEMRCFSKTAPIEKPAMKRSTVGSKNWAHISLAACGGLYGTNWARMHSESSAAQGTVGGGGRRAPHATDRRGTRSDVTYSGIASVAQRAETKTTIARHFFAAGTSTPSIFNSPGALMIRRNSTTATATGTTLKPDKGAAVGTGEASRFFSSLAFPASVSLSPSSSSTSSPDPASPRCVITAISPRSKGSVAPG
mmetsp:Transcript_13928/g.33766  ORF Transcript_13928/g.33766 Transcript_13928/m.33766 type:complete len:216 (-) Transcript_13928:209-856(-)